MMFEQCYRCGCDVMRQMAVLPGRDVLCQDCKRTQPPNAPISDGERRTL